jgi:hypothetical protein
MMSVTNNPTPGNHDISPWFDWTREHQRIEHSLRWKSKKGWVERVGYQQIRPGANAQSAPNQARGSRTGAQTVLE